MATHEITLAGCTTEPLMSYLQALGVLRIVAEQRDANARGCWRDGTFVLRSELDGQALVDFFIESYRPTPIVVPWSGADFFAVRRGGDPGPFRKTPTSSKIIEALIASKSSRLKPYRQALGDVFLALDASGLKTKKHMEDKTAKARFIAALRSSVADEVVRWIDGCAVTSNDKVGFNRLLGSGGGSDGNTHFSDNFMQNLWEVLPDFEGQKIKAGESSRTSVAGLRAALMATPWNSLVPKRTSSLYDGGSVGGPNAGQGFERVSLGNPWAFILCLEGTLLLAGSLVRRHGTTKAPSSAFPFQARLTPSGSDSTADKEAAGREVWMPCWSRWTTKFEVETLFSEGRATLGPSQAERGVDFARAAATLGVDRGIDVFQRYGLVRGRVGGENYNTSTSLGRFEVRARPAANLVREIDRWLERFRRAVSDTSTPPRFKAALRRIESAIFAFCQYGGGHLFAEILCALGHTERELSKGHKFREQNSVRPVAGLSPDWMASAFDNSPEFELAASLAGITDREHKVGPIRSNLEPVVWRRKRGKSGQASWSERDRAVVWNSADLATNLEAVLERRMMDSNRNGCQSLPVYSRRPASLDAIAHFLADETEDTRIEELLWGLNLVDCTRGYPAIPHYRSPEAPPLPRAYGLLKLLFLPHGIPTNNGEVLVRPESSVLPRLRTRGLDEAWAIATRRLRASGLLPLASRSNAGPAPRDERWVGDVSPIRLAAALLFPVSVHAARQLADLAIRPIANKTDAVQ